MPIIAALLAAEFGEQEFREQQRPERAPERRRFVVLLDRPALGAALLSVVLWASAFVGIRAVASDLSPGPLALGRLMIGSLALTVLVAFRPWRRPRAADLVRVGIAGILWFAIYNLALNTAEHNVDAGTAAMLVSTVPILIAISAAIFLGEGFPARLLLGCLVAMVGAVTIGLATSMQGLQVTGSGVALCLVAALAAAGGVTLEKPVLARISPLHVTWLACVTGAVICLPFAPRLAGELSSAPLISDAWLAYLGLFPTAVAFTCWAFALSRMPAGLLGTTAYLVPPVTIALAVGLLGEMPPPLAILGGAVCIGGVVIARSTRSPVAPRTGGDVMTS